MPVAQHIAFPAVSKPSAAARVPLPAAREHPADCTITGRPALERAAAQLRMADGTRQSWLGALGTWDVLRTQHCQRDGTVCVDNRPATTAGMAAALGASRTTLYAHLRLLLAAGLVVRVGRGWRLTELTTLEATRDSGQTISHLHTWRPAHAEAVARLRSADPTGRIWRSLWGALVLIRHRASWATGEFTGDWVAIAAALGIKVETWRSWQAVAAAADLLDVTDQGVVVRNWARLEGLDETSEDGPPTATAEARCPEFGTPCSVFGVESVQSLDAPIDDPAREALDVQATQQAHPQPVIDERGQEPDGRQEPGGRVYDALTKIAEHVPAGERAAVWASTALRRRVGELLEIPGASPDRVAALLCVGSWAGATDVVAVLVGHRAVMAREVLVEEADRLAAAAAEVRREADQRRDRKLEEDRRAALAAAAGQLPVKVLRAIVVEELARLDPQVPAVVRRSAVRAAAGVVEHTRRAAERWPDLPVERAVMLSAATHVVTRDHELYGEADELVEAVRARLTTIATGAEQ